MIYEFPHSITIEEYVKVKDSGGGNAITWTALKTTEAFVMPFRSSEYFHILLNQPEARFYFKVYIPYDDAVQRGMRVVYGEQTLNIQAVTDLGGEAEMMQLVCVELR